MLSNAEAPHPCPLPRVQGRGSTIFAILSILVLLGASVSSAADAPPALKPEQVDFFEKKIRPLFAEHCYACHSQRADRVKGGLLLDTRDGLLKGGNNGKVQNPGDTNSVLLRAVKHDGPLKMPKGQPKLSDEQIADLEAWVKMGAPDPRTGAPSEAAGPEGYLTKARKHWAFQPVHRPAVPQSGKDAQWCRTPVDAFVLAEMQKHGLSPSPEADRRSLIRRVTYDLTGLPPTYDEVQAFEKDPSPGAYDAVVDRLLGSPRYGERWGRHWLDVARYSDTAGYVGGDEERRYYYAYTYRDWVIRAMNEDLPYDAFLTQQIAADLIPSADPKSLAAMGFLTVGKRYLGTKSDIINDRMDVICRGLMGLTIDCARCHDHKFDPIPIADYYSLYGVFNSCVEPKQPELPLLPGGLPAAYSDFQTQLARRQRELEEFRTALEDRTFDAIRARTPEYLLAAYEVDRLPDKLDQQQYLLERKLDRQVWERWRDAFRNAKNAHDPVLGIWAEMGTVPDDKWALFAPPLRQELLRNDRPGKRINPIVLQALLGEPAESFRDVVSRYQRLYSEVNAKWLQLIAESTKLGGTLGRGDRSPEPAGFSDPDMEAIRQSLCGAHAPPSLRRPDLERFYDKPTKKRLLQFQFDINDLYASHPGSPARAQMLRDAPKIENAQIFIGGKEDRRGAEAPRQFLEILSGADRKPFPPDTSGRLQLAQAVASKENPLTARVFVNRVWLGHFGVPLVRTPSDFGVRAEPPSHPELLEFLASEFVEHGWSIKALHRLIVTSASYRQSAVDRNDCAEIDPSNKWLWRMNRQRLDFEGLRDSLLAAGGRLDLTMGGQSVDLRSEPFALRRTVYGAIDRLDYPELFRTFDVPNPDKTIAQRPGTTIPQQALFMMNAPFMVEQAKGLAARAAAGSSDVTSTVKRLYELAFQRPPREEELALARNFVKTSADTSARPADAIIHLDGGGWQFGLAKFDDATEKVTGFEPLSCFADEAFRAGKQDVKGPILSAAGGEVIEGTTAVVRRWVAPDDVIVRIAGELSRTAETGRAIEAKIFSDTAGTLASAIDAPGDSAKSLNIDRVAVKKGETIDFVVRVKGDAANAVGFKWSPVIRLINKGPADIAGKKYIWDARADFPRTIHPLTPIERLSQVMLMSNEFAFDN